MEKFVSKMGPTSPMAEWKSVWTGTGELCAMIALTNSLPRWCAGTLDIPVVVSEFYNADEIALSIDAFSFLTLTIKNVLFQDVAMNLV